MHCPRSSSVSTRIGIFECNFTKFSRVMLWKHPQKYSLWMACSSCHPFLYYRLNFFWHNLFLKLFNATTAYTVTNSSLWHYAQLTCCTCAGLHKVPISSTALLYFTDSWRAVVVDYSSRFVNVVRTMKSRVVANHVLWCHWFGEMSDLYICTYLLTCSHVDLPILSLLVVWNFMTSNESEKVLKVEAWYWTLLVKCVCKMLKLIM